MLILVFIISGAFSACKTKCITDPPTYPSATQIFPFSSRNGPSSETELRDLFIWLSIPIRAFLPPLTKYTFSPESRLSLLPLVLFTTYVVYSTARNPRKDPILAELPSPIDLEDDTSRTPWSNVAVADGIEDDDIEPEGQLRLE
jgi:hypothetical protein